MPAPKSNLTLVTAPAAESGEAEIYLSDPEIYLSDPERLEDGEGDWGFAAYVGEGDYRATFVFKDEIAAKRARETMAVALHDAIFIATADS
jgi:hypothetical protein